MNKKDRRKEREKEGKNKGRKKANCASVPLRNICYYFDPFCID